MKQLNRFLTTFTLLAALNFAPAASAQETEKKLVVPILVDPSKEVPMNISGFTGEVAQVLRFDLEVMGFVQSPSEKAKVIITGSNSDHVEGHAALAAAPNNWIVNKAYSGGSLRLQAHSLA